MWAAGPGPCAIQAIGKIAGGQCDIVKAATMAGAGLTAAVSGPHA